MKRILTAASLMLVLVAAPIALAGEGHACCKKGDKTAASTEKCDPKNCPKEKCEKHAADKSGAKTETAKPAVKPAKPA